MNQKKIIDTAEKREYHSNCQRERETMSKKNKVQKVAIISAIEIFEMRKPQYNGFTCGYGAHGNKGYNRRKVKEQFRREEW